MTAKCFHSKWIILFLFLAMICSTSLLTAQVDNFWNKVDESVLTKSNPDQGIIPLANLTYSLGLDKLQTTVFAKKDITPSDCLLGTLKGENAISGVPQLLFPEDGNNNVEQSTLLTWGNVINATSYVCELATNPGFGGAIIKTNEISNHSILIENLNPLTIYYWRVKSKNSSEESEYSNTFSFQTNSLFCNTYDSPDVPLIIDPSSVVTIASELPISDGFEITEMKLNIDVSHTFVGDLTMYFRSVNIGGPGILLLDKPGVPNTFFGCPEDNLKVQFDDNSPNDSEQLNNTCVSNAMYAIEGVFQPIEPLSTFVGENSNQTWELSIIDLINLDGGALNSWSLELCGDIPGGQVTLHTNQTLFLFAGETKTINSTHLFASSSTNNSQQIIYTILGNTAHGELQLNGSLLGVGSTFTQQDIDNGTVTYTHINLNQEIDNFNFSIETPDGGWSTGHQFNIDITLNVLNTTAILGNDIDCHNQNNGQIAVVANGTSPPFQYSLDGVTYQNSPVFNNLSEGVYIVTVKDNIGFTQQTNSITITNPPILSVTAAVSGSDLNASGIGGTGNLEYSLDGINFQASPEFLGLPNGSYEITVRDANGCTATTTAQIAVNTLVVQASLGNDITCHNFNDGTIVVTVTGGTPPLQYSLAGVVFQNNNTFTNLSAGSYMVTVLDSEGFTQQTNSVNVTNPPILSVTATVLEYDLTASGIGGTGNLEYSLDGINFQASPEFLDLPNGSYEITVRDANGCTATTTAQIAVNTLVVQASLGNNITCHNFNDGTIVVTVTGGTPPFQYSLDAVVFQNNNTFTSLSAGSYMVTVLDSEGFTQQTNSINVTNPPILSLTATVLEYDLTASGIGGTGNLEYSLDGVNFQTSPEFLGLANGNYEITVRDANGCTATTTAQVAVNALVVQASLGNDITCHNFNDGTIIVTASGGAPPLQYSLDGIIFQNNNTFTNLQAGSYVMTVLDSGGVMQQTNSVNVTNPPILSLTATVLEYDLTASGNGGTGNLEYSLDEVNFQTSPEFLGLTNGNYEITVRDENGCTETTTAEVAVLLVAQSSLGNDITCHNFNDGTIIVTASGGTPPFQYSLDGVVFQNNNTFTNLLAGSYVITVLDSEGSSLQTNSVNVTNPNLLSLSATVSEYDLTAAGNGGTGNLEYSLDGINFQTSPEFLGLTNGNYEITVRDENGCTETTTAEIAVNTLVVESSLENDITCYDFNDGTIVVTASGGTPPLQYSLDGIVFQDNNTFTNLSAGSYMITVLDSEGFTQQTNSVNVTNPNLLSLSATVSENDLTASGIGGTGNLEYSLDGVNFQTSPEFLGLTNGDYEITVQDTNECTATTTAEVAVNTLVVESSLENDITCHDFNDGTIIVTASGGTPPLQYSLDGIVFQDNNTFTSLSAGSYMVTVLDSEGFTQQTNSVNITNPTLLSLSATVSENDLMASGNGGTGNLEYSLDGLNFQTSSEFLNLPNGDYEITVRDENGCTATTTAEVGVNTLVVESSLENDITCHDFNDGTIIVTVSGGTPPLQYSLDGIVFQNNNTFTNLSAGSYVVTVLDSEGFTQQTNSVNITNPNLLSLSATVSENDLSISGNGGTGNLEYSLDGVNFQTSPEFLNLIDGNYEITVRDANGCTAITTAQVAVDAMVVQAFLDNEISCFDGDDGQIIVNAAGGTPPLQYSLDGIVFQDSNTFSNLSAGSYMITVKDADGFEQQTNQIIFSNPNQIIFFTTVNENNVTITASGGTGNLEYSSDGINFQNSNTFSDLPNEIYTFVIKDVNGCMETTVLEINLITNASTSINDVSCFGFSDGSISITQVEGGSPDYQYSLDGINFQVESFFEGLVANDYQVWIMDATGSVFQTNLISIVEPMEFTISTIVDENNVTINANGGTGDLTYSINGIDFQTSNVFENLPNAEYTIIVLDENGCLYSTTILVDFTNIDELDFSLKFDLYPNPNQGDMIISFNKTTEENLNLKIFDVSGKLVLDNDFIKNNNEFTMNIDVEYLSSGTYYLLLTDGYLLGRKRFIKMN